MLTLFKKNFHLVESRNAWNKIKDIFYGKLVGMIQLVINTMKVKMEKDG